MKAYFETRRGKLYCGDCLEVMKSLQDNAIDTVITDPPYGLKFMGKDWDHGVPGKPYWEEVLRISKPGTLLLAFGGTRTYHRLTCAIEDAGWEIQDCLMWIYGSGFPKSHDISKAIDKKLGAERAMLYKNPNCRANRAKGIVLQAYSDHAFITKPATIEVELWQGYGTALKPSYESVVLAIKPIDKTFANNALKWGCGGLNIDGCRIKGELPHHNYGRTSGKKSFTGKSEEPFNTPASGRWPANVIFNEEAAALLDEQSGLSKSGGNVTGNENSVPGNGRTFGKMGRVPWQSHNDSGYASRFFYCAKASPSERGKFNDHPTVKPINLIRYLCTLVNQPRGSTVIDPFCGSGTIPLVCEDMGLRWLGIEISEEYCAIAKKRILRETRQRALF